MTEVRVAEGSPLVGKTIREAELGAMYDLNALHVHRCCQEGETVAATTDHRLQAGDEIHLEATPEALLNASQELKLEPVPDRPIEPWSLMRRFIATGLRSAGLQVLYPGAGARRYPEGECMKCPAFKFCRGGLATEAGCGPVCRVVAEAYLARAGRLIEDRRAGRR